MIESNKERSFWFGKKVLITGHTGFKGSWLTIYLLLKGANVYGFSLPKIKDSLYSKLELNKQNLDGKLYDNFGSIIEKNNFEKFLVDLQPDIVFHLAAQSLVRKSYLSPYETWNVNLMGSINLIESLNKIEKKCACIVVTTDKVYANQNQIYSYREIDPLGGKDPYSASKSAVELAINSWRSSFCGLKSHQIRNLGISTVRAGNVVGGGDWAEDRIVPDAIRSLIEKKSLNIRNPKSIRPWQHVLEPLNGYVLLAKEMYESLPIADNDNQEIYGAFNFGPTINSNKSVEELFEVEAV